MGVYFQKSCEFISSLIMHHGCGHVLWYEKNDAADMFVILLPPASKQKTLAYKLRNTHVAGAGIGG